MSDSADDPLAPRVYAGDENAQRRWAETHIRVADPQRSGVAELPSRSGNGTNGSSVDGAAAVQAARVGLRVDFSPLSPRSHDVVPAPAEPSIQVDYELVAVLQAEVSRLVIEALRGETSVTNDHRRRITRELTDAVVRRNVDTRLRSG